MKILDSWNHLEPLGIDPLTGEACGLGYRILCDVTARGKRILEKCFGIPSLTLPENWNRGKATDPHVGSIMLSYEMLVPVGIFALLESGCTEVWLYRNGSLRGIEPTDSADEVQMARAFGGKEITRTFSYRGTAADRNVHVMSGRIT